MSNYGISLKQGILWILKIIFLSDFIKLIITQPAPSVCTEQWNESKNWQYVGDVIYKNETGFVYNRDPNQPKSAIGDVGGAAWYNISKNNINGIKFSFIPTIDVDLNYYGNVKYPQGFAVVFTANPTNKVIGEKRSGLGYDGINAGVAFEWDLIQNSDKKDIRDAHFSVHHNLNGPVSSISPDNCKNMCNIKIANFYDDQKENFFSEIVYKIEIFSGKLYVYQNEKAIVNGVPFTQLEQLMDQNEVYFGITSSLNLYKSVYIKDFKFFQIAKSKQVVLSTPQPRESYEAGSFIELNIFLNSICGKNLMIYSQELKYFGIKINSKLMDNFNPVFDTKIYGLSMKINNLKEAKRNTLTPVYKTNDSLSVDLLITPGTFTKYDICDPIYDIKTNILSYNRRINGKFITFTICSTDQYRNPKISNHKTDEDLVKIEYPYTISPSNSIKVENKEDKTQYLITVPLTSIGRYIISNENFFGGVKKYFDIKITGVDSENSYGEIRNYFEDRIAKTNKQIILYLNLKDSYGNQISSGSLSNLKCSFQASQIDVLFQGVKNTYNFTFASEFEIPIIDNYPAISFTPTGPGEYTFRPRVKCLNDNSAGDIKCSLCTFYISTSVLDVTRLKLFSDFKNDYYLSNQVKPLYISLDENKNIKLTTIRFVDTSGMELPIKNIDITRVVIDLQLNGVAVAKITQRFNPIGVIDIFLEPGKDRTTTFSPILFYYLLIKIKDTGNVDFPTDITVPVQFAYKDDYLNNVNLMSKVEVAENFIGVYIPGKFSIPASTSRLMFKIIARNANKELTMGDGLVPESVSVVATDSKNFKYELNPITVKSGIFLYVTVLPTKAGSYNVDLIYNSKNIQSVPLVITPRPEVYALTYNDKNEMIKSIVDNTITLKDEIVGKLVSFTMTMVDEFNNVINDNYLSIFNSISVKTIGDISIEPLFDGRLSVVSKSINPGSLNVILTLANGISYTVKFDMTSSIIDPSMSTSEIAYQANYQVGNSVQIKLKLADKYRNDISATVNSTQSSLKDFKDATSVFLYGPQNTLHVLEFSEYKDGFFFFNLAENKLIVAGEYKLNVYHNNVPIFCSICFANFQYLQVDYSKTSLFIVGHKSNKRVYNETTRYQIILSSDPFSAYLVFKDKFGNELNKIDSNIELYFTSEISSNSTVRLCRLPQDVQLRLYYSVCDGDDQTNFSKLPKGKYFIEVGDGLRFKFYLDTSYYASSESGTPSPNTSYLRNENGGVIGSTDSPARMVIDFRSEQYLRYSNLDISKVSVTSEISDPDLNVKYLFGPIKGLVTALVFSKRVGSNKLTVKFGDSIILKDIIFMNNPGKLSSMTYLPTSTLNYSSGRYYFFQLFDMYGNKCGFDTLAETNLRKYIINVFSSRVNGTVSRINNYNPLTGVFSFMIEKFVDDVLKFESPFLNGTITLPADYNSLDNEKSFAYLENDNNEEVNNKVLLKFQPLDAFRNYLSYEKIKLEQGRISVIVVVTDSQTTRYVATIPAQYSDDKREVYSEFIFTQPGDYLFIPTFKGVQILCTLCRKTVNSGAIVLSNTQLQVKSGDVWFDKTPTLVYKIFQNTYPVFKINFRDSSNYIINSVLMTKYSFELSSYDTATGTNKVLATEVLLTNKNGVYVYLTPEGRTDYLNLKAQQTVKLVIKELGGTTIEFVNFVIFNSEKETSLTSSCNNDAVPTFLSSIKKYDLQAGNDLIIGIGLKGCPSQLTNLFNTGFTVVSSNNSITGKVVPADINGRYLLVISGKESTTDEASISLKFKDSQLSESISVSVRPDYTISKYVFSSDGKYTSIDTHASFEVLVRDSFNNIITRDQSMFFYNDIFLTLQDSNKKIIPYKVTFFAGSTKFRVQFGISYYDTFTVSSKYSDVPFVLQVNPGKEAYNSFAVVSNSNIANNFDVKITLRDSKYKIYTNKDLIYSNEFSFKYFTYNTFTLEQYTTDINASNIKLKDPADPTTLTITIPSDSPKYQYSMIIPYSAGIYHVVCSTCVAFNPDIKDCYGFTTDDSNNSYYTLPSNIVFLKGRENPIIVTESSSADLKVSLSSYEIGSIVYSITNQRKLVFIGMDTNTRNSQDIKGTNDLNISSIVIPLTIDDKLPTKNDIDMKFSNVISRANLKFRAGEKAYFYLETRDSNNTFTTKDCVIKLSEQDLKYNIVKSNSNGLYLIEVSTQTVPKSNSFKVIINNKEISRNVILDISPDYPINLDVNTQVVEDWTTVQYTVVSTDKFKNPVCDNRINLVARLSNQIIQQDIYYDINSKSCKVKFYFSGYVYITSPLFKEGTKMNLENLGQVLISSFASSLILDQNNSQTNSPITVTVKLLSTSGFQFPSDTNKPGIALKVYELTGYNSKRLIKSIEGISTLINSYTPQNLGITYGDYILSAVVDGSEMREYSPFRYYKSFVQEPNSIQVNVKVGADMNIIDKIYDPSTSSFEPITLKYPFTLYSNYINLDNQKIYIPKKSKFEVKLLDGSTKAVLFTLESMINTETTYTITVPKDKVNLFSHLPKGNYIMSFLGTINDSKKIEKYVYLNFIEGVYQKNNLIVPYSLPGTALSDTLDLIRSTNDKIINTNVGSYSRTNLCLKSNNSIYNDYLEPDKLSIGDLDTSNCNLYKTISFRGCLEFVLLCKKVASSLDGYKITVFYGNVKLISQISIFIDPQLPPSKVKVELPFNSKVQQRSEINAQFNLLDGNNIAFQYLNSDNFEVFINNFIVDISKWKIVYLNSVLNLKLFNVDYPPRNQKIDVYFKDSVGGYLKLKEISTDMTVSQGAFDNKKIRISLPVSYYAGNPLSFLLIVRDVYSNCYEDDIDITKFNLKLTLSDVVFTDFSIAQENLDFILCKSVLRINTKTLNDSPMKKVGEYKLELFYDTTSITSTFIKVLPNQLSPEKSLIRTTKFGDSRMVNIAAGEILEIEMTGTDAYENKLSFPDLADRMNIKIEGLTKDVHYSFQSRVSEDFLKIYMYLTFTVLGRYQINYYIDDNNFINQKGLKEVLIGAGACSSKYPMISIPDLKFYTGDFGKIIISCRDNYNNTITNLGNEKFTISIKGNDLEIVKEDNLPYTLNFNEFYTARFLFAYGGNYTVQINLNGHKYGNSTLLTVLPQKCPSESPIMCSNKLCVKSVIECALDIDSSCKDLSKPFKCSVKAEKICVNSITECDCPDGFSKCNGMCLPKAANFCDQTVLSTNCSTKLGLEDYKTCQDRSCRSKNSRCGNPLACPLGFKPCGITCINRNIACNVAAPICKPSEVMCWDLTCAENYDICPTAKTCKNENDFVCPDGKCVSKSTECTQPPTCNEPFNKLCSDFTCKKSIDECLKRPVCFPGESLCENNSCAKECSNITSCSTDQFLCATGQCKPNPLLCPTAISCPAGTVKCPSGTCASSFEQCGFSSSSNTLTCPLNFPILCSDLSCVDNISKCKSITDCPTFAPFRCPDNECRKNLLNCPSTTTCPDDYPVLCSDGTCQKASYHCSSLISEKCDKVRCSDGSCVNSLSLCPNQVSCGNGLSKCWDGSCVRNITEECRTPKYVTCPETQPFRCQDGSCRVNRESCSTISICPFDKPVKCYDSSCREHISLCPQYQSCSKLMKSCPDGTCTLEKCNTIVTCPPSSPFLCFDNSCKQDIRDCLPQPFCIGFICPDGSCVSNRQFCKFFDECPPSNPIRCANGGCVSQISECMVNSGECPTGYVKCKYGGCKINEGLCEELKCPTNLPYLCPEGVCAKNITYCDVKKTGCPFNIPHHCDDFGICVRDLNECTQYVRNTTSYKCSEDSFRCLDGSCAKKFEECPIENGCPKAKPKKCADGTCIDNSEYCIPPACGFDNPIKCQNGECRETSNKCPSFAKESDYNDCAEIGFPGKFMCANGRCVDSSSECRPLISCPDKMYLCSNGLCKISSTLCPKTNNCPSNRPFRCANGKCSKDESECVVTCENKLIRCDKNGDCVKNATISCPATDLKVNGCPSEMPVKCMDGRCMNSTELCKTINIACTVENPVLCPNGICVQKRENCKQSDQCQDGFVKCPDGLCVEKEKYFIECKNKIGCPFTTPVRCTNGKCVSDYNSCLPTVSCSNFKPIICADFTCVSDSRFCNVFNGCSSERPIKCNNGLCAKSDQQCEEYSYKYCPITSPIRCFTGRCVSHIRECSEEFYRQECREYEIYCALKASCVQSASDCVGENRATGKKPGSSRLLQINSNTSNASNTSEPIPAPLSPNTTFTPENGCEYNKPFSCFDGTCSKTRDECPIPPPCDVLEYRCPNGSCQKDKSKCKYNAGICEEGLKICEDGLCRKTCPEFNGCSLSKPFQCPNGMCLKNIIECIGYSMCKSEEPYRCMNGNCVPTTNSCPDIKRLIFARRITASVSKYSDITLPFIFDRFKRNIGSIYFPGNSISLKNSTDIYANIEIKQVPHSKLFDNALYNNSESIWANVSNGIPASDGILNFENSILSTIFEISISNVDADKNLNFEGVIKIEHNYYYGNKFLTNDYCLARIEKNAWVCVTRKEKEDQTMFTFDKFGIYAVILSPNRKKIALDPSLGKNFFFENIKIISIILGSLLLASIIVFYIFTRIIRYRQKYKELKQLHMNIENEKEDYRLIATDVPGQTVGDTVKGIIYTKNLAHSVTESIKGSSHDLENEIEDLQRKCRAMENQNRTIESKIQDINDQYRMLKLEIDRLKN